MAIACVITLDDNPEAVYYGGQLLSGHVDLTLSESKKVRGKKWKVRRSQVGTAIVKVNF